MNIEFEDIRPCNNDEIGEKLLELMQDESFMHLMKTYFPMVDLAQIAQSGKGFSNPVEFQTIVIRPILEALISKAATSLTVSGEANITDETAVFLSNHRDIVMDPALLSLSLMRTITACIEQGWSGFSKRTGSRVLIFSIASSFLIPRQESSGPVIPTSVI